MNYFERIPWILRSKIEMRVTRRNSYTFSLEDTLFSQILFLLKYETLYFKDEKRLKKLASNYSES